MKAVIKPIKNDPTGLTASHLAVIPIKPAKAPLIVMPKFGLPYLAHARNIAVKAPTEAAKLVVMKCPLTPRLLCQLLKSLRQDEFKPA